MEKHFLDSQGLTALWSKILQEDYTNNQTLTAVINAIDQTKQNKYVLISAQLLKNNWDNNLQTIMDEEILLGDQYLYIVDCNGASIQANDVSVEGQMTFSANIIPTQDINITIIRVEV